LSLPLGPGINERLRDSARALVVTCTKCEGQRQSEEPNPRTGRVTSGSPRAVREGIEIILDVIPHAIEKLKGLEKECAG